NAYGHYLVDFSKKLENLGIDFLGVDSVVEATELRKHGIRCPILVLGYTLPENFEEAVRRDIELAISSAEQLSFLETTKQKPLPAIHIKVDTGMHRQGFGLSDMARVAEFLAKNQKTKRVRIAGLFTHFAGAKGKENAMHTRRQIEELRKWVRLFRASGYSPLTHAAASGGTFLFSESHFGMVRIGIGLYGIYPSWEIEKKLGKKIHLKPVLSWRTVISEVKKLPKGATMGYDRTETLKRDSLVAVCPVGYWHGFPRALSSIGEVLVRGKRAKVLGRVSMDMVSVDVTGIRGARPGDTVTLIGKDGKERLCAEDIARRMDASPYELVTRINPLIKRFFI
ncbi:MAG: alanine racemase, partial [bacterium]|nr:alanine racemase [bacterium]